jgi:hypothetical protein
MFQESLQFDYPYQHNFHSDCDNFQFLVASEVLYFLSINFQLNSHNNQPCSYIHL